MAANNRYSGLYGNIAKKPNTGVQQSLGGGGFFSYGSQQPSSHFGAPNHGASQRQLQNMPRVNGHQPERMPSSQPSLMYGSQYASQSQPSLGHESQSLVVPVSGTPQRTDHGGYRQPTYWAQPQNSSLAKRLLTRAETAGTPPLPGPQAVAKLQLDQMMSVLESISTRMNELSRPSDIKENIENLSQQVEKKLADLSASLDIPARFTALQKAVDALQCQHQSLTEHVQQHNQKPPVALCHVPTQVSPPAPPILVSASAQVSSPMLVTLRTRVSAGTHMTPPRQRVPKNVAAAPSDMIKRTENKQTGSRAHNHHTFALVHRNTNRSPTVPPTGDAEDDSRQWLHHNQEVPQHSPSDRQQERRVERTAGKASGGEMKQAVARGAHKALSNTTNDLRSHRKHQNVNQPVKDKENSQVAVVQHSSRHSKLKRAAQNDKPIVTPARKKSRHTSCEPDMQAMQTTPSCAPCSRAAPVQSHDDYKTGAEASAEADSFQAPQQHPTASAVLVGSTSMENEPKSPHAVQEHPSIDNTALQMGQEEVEVSDSGQRTGGSVALVISGATVSMGFPQRPRDDCQDLYQQLIVGKRSGRKPEDARDEADSRPVSGIHKPCRPAAATSQVLHSVFKKTKAASPAGITAALPPQVMPRKSAVEAKSRRPPPPAAAPPKRSNRGQRLPKNVSAIKAHAPESRQGGRGVEHGGATRAVSGRHTAGKLSSHKQTPAKPPTATKRISGSRRRPAGSQKPSLSSSLFAVERAPKRRNADAAAPGQSDQDMAIMIRQRKRETALMRRSGVLTMHETAPYMLSTQDFNDF